MILSEPGVGGALALLGMLMSRKVERSLSQRLQPWHAVQFHAMPCHAPISSAQSFQVQKWFLQLKGCLAASKHRLELLIGVFFHNSFVAKPRQCGVCDS